MQAHVPKALARVDATYVAFKRPDVTSVLGGEEGWFSPTV